jgi:hypothetical protein
MPQSSLSAAKSGHWLAGLQRDELLARATQARALAKPEATARVVAVCKELSQ